MNPTDHLFTSGNNPFLTHLCMKPRHEVYLKPHSSHIHQQHLQSHTILSWDDIGLDRIGKSKDVC